MIVDELFTPLDIKVVAIIVIIKPIIAPKGILSRLTSYIYDIALTQLLHRLDISSNSTAPSPS